MCLLPVQCGAAKRSLWIEGAVQLCSLRLRMLVVGVLLSLIAIGSGFRVLSVGGAGSALSRRSMAPLNWKVTVVHEGEETVLEVDEGTSILEASLDAGVDLPHDCDLGVCLTCPAKIESGTCDQSSSTLDDSVIEEGFALTCQTYPRSDVVIRSIEEDELVDAQFADRD